MDTINLKEKTIIVTGGSGYLGRFLVNALIKEGASVFNLSKDCKPSNSEFNIDITNFNDVYKIVQQIKPDVIFHLAADINRSRSFENYEKIMSVNVNGTFNILKSIEKIDCHFIFTSTSEIYGNNASPFHEDQIPQPVSPYSLSKINAENLIQTYCKNYGKNYTNLRIFNFFGEHMSEDFFINQMIKSLQKDEDFLMTKGKQIRDFLYVGDVVDALLLTAKNKSSYNQTLNICSGKGVQLKELANYVSKNINSKAKVIKGALPYRKNEVWEMVGDNTKAKQSIGFTPNFSIEEGIKILIEHS